MKSFIASVLISILTISATSLPILVWADHQRAADSETYSPAQSVSREYRPTAEAMIFDGLVIRPLALGATAVGAVVFVITSPFSLLGGNADEAATALVSEPAAYTFKRCLGCFPSSYHQRLHYHR